MKPCNILMTAFLLLAPLAAFADDSQAQAEDQVKTQAQAEQKAAQDQQLKAADAQKLAKQNRDQLEQQLHEAQAKLQVLAQQVAQLSLQLSGPEMDNDGVYRVDRVRRMQPDHAILGVTIFGSGNRKQRDIGVNVTAVTPGGPAEKAGLRAGDMITAINGNSFKYDGHESPNDQLLAFMDKVKPGDKLKVSYLRNGKPAQTNVTAGGLGSDSFAFAFATPPEPPIPPAPPVPPGVADMAAPVAPTMPPEPRNFMWFMDTDGVTGDMQLVPLSKELGQYFGTDKGLLVVHAPQHSALKLEDGDVILKIGGRIPGAPPHAMRILHSYSPGDSLKLDIMRKGKPLNLDIKLPADGGAGGDISDFYRNFHFAPGFTHFGFE